MLEEDIVDAVEQLFLSETLSDVVFKMENHRIPAHRLILAARVDYFRALLYGNLAEAQQREITLDCNPEAFKEVLRYIYTGCFSVATSAEGVVNTLRVLELAQVFMMPKLVSDIVENVGNNLALDNVCTVLSFALPLHFDNLLDACVKLIDESAVELIHHESFSNLTKVGRKPTDKEALLTIIERDTFAVPEVKIFKAAYKWYMEDMSDDNKEVFSHIRLCTMEVEDIIRVVQPTGLYTKDEEFQAITARWQSENLPYRFFRGGHDQELRFISTTFTNLEQGGANTVLELAANTVINHVEASFVQTNVRYSLEVSQNKSHWERVVDYGEYDCDKTQYLYFEERPVRYVKFVHTTEARDWNVLNPVLSKAMLSTKMPQMVNGVVIPTENVISYANTSTFPCLFEGDSLIFDVCARNTIFSIIKLNQPYHVGSIRLFYKESLYLNAKFIIQTSQDEVNWKMILNGCSAYVAFEPHVVLYVKISGTGCSKSSDPLAPKIFSMKLELPAGNGH